MGDCAGGERRGGEAGWKNGEDEVCQVEVALGVSAGGEGTAFGEEIGGGRYLDEEVGMRYQYR